ncbi:MAG: hypothetical protein R3272_03605 [Candidatus Promineifilaceae bacterium]|nr:hypothetical protein [Candidatus Promineifilaceae bacterium]
MKNSSFIAILLTLIMLLLVAGGTIFFLFQSQQALETEVEQLTVEAADLDNAVAVFQAQAAAREVTIATLEATLSTREAESALRATTVAGAGIEEPPFVEIAHPRSGAIVTADTLPEVLVFTGHPLGVVSAALLLDGQIVAEVESGPGERNLVLTHSLAPPLAPGQHVLTATVTAANALTRSEAIIFTVLGPEGESGLPGSALCAWPERAPSRAMPFALPPVGPSLSRCF